MKKLLKVVGTGDRKQTLREALKEAEETGVIEIPTDEALLCVAGGEIQIEGVEK